MATGQRKLGKFVVIEGEGFPVARVMAGVAAVTVIAFVRIVFLMTTDARRCDNCRTRTRS